MLMKIKTVDNKELVDDIRARLKANDGYCPCANKKTPETKCMCKPFREQDYPGECHCGLYEKVEE